MTQTSTPKDAAAVVLTRGNQVCWAKRSAKLGFLSGWHAFPGGKLELSDAEVAVKNCDEVGLAKFIACAARECFEETGVLLARGGEKMTKGQRASLYDDLASGRMTFAEILEHWELWLDAADFKFVGAWTTPAFSPIRFNTRFFQAECPPKQTPFAASGELEEVELIAASDAVKRWESGEILCAPPILKTIRVLSSGIENSLQKLLEFAEREGANPRRIEFNSRFTVFPLKTLTLPPATHTNCFIVGRREFIVIDAATRDENEQTALHELIDSLIEEQGVCRAIVVSHLHSDHIGGEQVLQQYLRAKHNQPAPLVAHRLTADSLPQIKFEQFLEDNDVLSLQDENGRSFELQVLHTPGHARGHLCFYDAEFGFLLSSDNVTGAGSVLIAPPEGNMRDYLYSLERMLNLPNLRFLCGSHGAAIAEARSKIESYIQHRLEREKKIIEAVNQGAKTPEAIVEQVYTDVKPEMRSWAEKSVLAHLEKLQAESKI